MKLVSGKYYTVKSGRFAGIVGVACDPVAAHGDVHGLHSIDFPDGVLSFLGCLSKLRVATAKEELEYRRRCDS
jgi:hypothetical protein